MNEELSAQGKNKISSMDEEPSAQGKNKILSVNEELSAQQQSINPISNQQSRVQKRTRQQKRSSCYTPKWRSKIKIQPKWSIVEKSRLLEALKRYDSHNISSIVKLVGTKSEEEVQDKITSLRGVESKKCTRNRVTGPGSEKAPIEAWIDLVHEMIKHEPADYSQLIPKVLGLITRNEKFEDTGNPQFKWRNIYQFLTDITDDRLEAQKLSDIESLVVLDMMHSLGDTLLKSDTAEQRQILDFKYNLLNFKSDNPNKYEKEINIHRIAQALSNDFWDIEDAQQGSSLSQSSSSSAVPNDSTQQLSETSSETRNGTDMTPESTATSFQHIQTSSRLNVNIGASGTKPANFSPSSTLAGQKYSTKQISEKHNSGNSSSHESSSAEDGNTSFGVKLRHSEKFGKHFERPKYFSLNPLCVPTKRLALQPKTIDKQ
uniref:Myb-like domain-containing protein n=1 Tax=Arion vulgaris TaxID=1028688 RepID=A0A0B7AQU5_9EUPU